MLNYSSWCYYTSFLNTADDTSSLHNISFSFLQMLQAPKAPLCKGGWQKSLISDWGIVLVDTLQSFRHGYRRATSLYTREALRPTIILQITLLVSVNRRRIYRRIYFLLSSCYDKQKAVIT